MAQEFIEFEGKLITQTERAGLFEIENDQYWIPWSQVDEGSIDTNGEEGPIYMTEWIAEQKGLL